MTSEEREKWKTMTPKEKEKFLAKKARQQREAEARQRSEKNRQSHRAFGAQAVENIRQMGMKNTKCMNDLTWH
jgi:predicted Fe-S protein YdhL (DUF1289 family)